MRERKAKNIVLWFFTSKISFCSITSNSSQYGSKSLGTICLVDRYPEQISPLTFQEISELWQESGLNYSEELPLRTFHNHQMANKNIFDVYIDCDRKNCLPALHRWVGTVGRKQLAKLADKFLCYLEPDSNRQQTGRSDYFWIHPKIGVMGLYVQFHLTVKIFFQVS